MGEKQELVVKLEDLINKLEKLKKVEELQKHVDRALSLVYEVIGFITKQRKEFAFEFWENCVYILGAKSRLGLRTICKEDSISSIFEKFFNEQNNLVKLIEALGGAIEDIMKVIDDAIIARDP